MLEQQIQLHPRDVTAHYQKGLVLQDSGRPQEALVSFEETILLDPLFAGAHYSKDLTLLRADFLHETSKIVEHSRYLPLSSYGISARLY
jgi:hypothetical protein